MANRQQVIFLTIFGLGLVAIGMFRWASFTSERFVGLSEFPTILFVSWVAAFAFAMPRVGLSFRQLVLAGGFRIVPHVLLGAIAATMIVVLGDLLLPVWETLFNVPRDLARFSTTTQSLPGLVLVLAFSWTFAAIGEELTFRGILMRGLIQAQGGGTVAMILILVAQALVFGLVHAYQGPAGMAGASISGLIFGAVVLMSKGSLWPAVFAHGFANSYGLISLWLAS